MRCFARCGSRYRALDEAAWPCPRTPPLFFLSNDLHQVSSLLAIPPLESMKKLSISAPRRAATVAYFLVFAHCSLTALDLSSACETPPRQAVHRWLTAAMWDRQLWWSYLPQAETVADVGTRSVQSKKRAMSVAAQANGMF